MQIYDHDNPESIELKKSSKELDDWISHLNYIELEINNLLNLGNTQLSKTSDFRSILEKLTHKKEENTIAIDSFLSYKESLPKAAECEDVDCDMFYVSEHEKFRKNYLNHLKRYREVKEEYFRLLSK